MKEKSNQDCNQLFREVEAVIDRVVTRTCDRYTQMGYTAIEFSNRTGFDMSGYSCFFLQIDLQKDSHDGSFIVRETVKIDYAEPLTWENPRVLTVSAITDRFQLGTQSSPVSRETLKIEAERLIESALEEAIDKCIRADH
jgi:hypothetical protein